MDCKPGSPAVLELTVSLGLSLTQLILKAIADAVFIDFIAKCRVPGEGRHSGSFSNTASVLAPVLSGFPELMQGGPHFSLDSGLLL